MMYCIPSDRILTFFQSSYLPTGIFFLIYVCVFTDPQPCENTDRSQMMVFFDDGP